MNDKMLDWTVERFLPWIEDAKIHYEHFHRYAFAAQFVKGKRVLDMACGDGYGSNMLSKEAEYVVGIDINENFVNHAHGKYMAKNLKFKQGSIINTRFQKNEKFDVIVCFECLEHIEEHEQFLSEVKRLLKKDGLFIVSTQNKKKYRDDMNLLKNYFKNSIFFGQKVYCSSNIWQLTRYNRSGYKEFVIEKNEKEFYFSEPGKKNPLYFIAIASDKALDQDHFDNSSLIDVSDSLIGDFQKQISEFNNTIQTKDEQIINLNNALNAIHQSITWRMVMKYHIVLEKLLPQGTIRRNWYDFTLKSIRITLYEGIGGLWWHYKERKRVKKLEGQRRKNIKRIQASDAVFNEATLLDVMRETPHMVDMNRILVIDRCVPRYDKESGALRMYSILSILSNLGYKVTLLPDDLHKIEPYTNELQKMDIEVLGENINEVDYLKKIGNIFGFVIISRPEQAFKYIPLIRAYAINSVIIYDTVDLHWLRLERSAFITGKKDFINQSNYYKSLELFNASCSDIVFTVTEDEKNILLKELPGLNIEIIPNIHDLFKSDTQFEERKDLMFVGGFLHQPNEDAVIYFVEKIFPLIKEKIEDIKFFVVGSDPSVNLMKLKSKNIIVTGYVKDLTPYFEACRVFVSPLRYGAGMKGKIGQSMSYGLPVVTTAIGAEGIGLVDGCTALIADEPRAFAEAVIKLYTNESLWYKISEKSMKHIQKNYSKETISNTIGSLFSKIKEKKYFIQREI